MEKKMYIEEAIERYETTHNYIVKQMERLNEFQKIHDFRPFNDVTIRCINAEVGCIKYFKQNNIDLENESNSLLLYACQYYIQDKLNEAVNELNRYIDELEMLFIGKQSTLKVKILEFFSKKDLSRKIFSVAQHHVNKYRDIGDEITNINIEEDIDKIIRCYINKKHEEFLSLEEFPYEAKQNLYESTITIASDELKTALKNAKLYKGIYAVDDEITKTLQRKEEVKTLKRK